MTNKSWNGMNILEYIDWLMEQGISEENAEEIASNEFFGNDNNAQEEEIAESQAYGRILGEEY